MPIIKPISQTALDFLQTDSLRHLVHLKYLHLYGDQIDCHYVQNGESRGIPTVTPCDSHVR